MAFKQFLGGLIATFLAVSTAIGAANAETFKIVGLGDSLMAGYMLDAGESFPEKLEEALKARGHDVVITNAGVSGDTTSGGLSRLDWSVPDDTDLVILELGANDMLRGIPPELTERNLVSMIERLRERGIEILLAGMMAAPNLGSGYADEFNAIYPRLAEKYDLAFYPFFLDGVAAERSLLLDDGMHPNPQGVDRMVEGALPAVEKMLPDKADNS
ncbi:arylesterase [Aquamicrobium sp. LC103]|uniref:arylesterase n=1 Tax=Aquamicrobium sp. LC103 TaxID=1120658 RepID=UPI00063EA564|nr:arylesterase [Aquamicrobium sp. LC103]TKT82877.1 arylesterase [Aquamicrobium sp. LC103]